MEGTQDEGIWLDSIKTTAVVGYDTNVIKGDHVTVSAANPATDDQLQEKKNVDNDGKIELTFPEEYEGDCLVKLRGSTDGERELTFHVGGSDE
jgi:hypothetical protein